MRSRIQDEFSRLDALAAGILREPRLKDRVKLMIIGAGPLDEKIQALKNAFGRPERVLQAGMIEYQELPRYLSLGDIGINSFEINKITANIAPIKVWQYLASGMQVVSTPLADLKEMLPEPASGVTYARSDSIDDLIGSVCEVVQEGAMDVVGRGARNYAEENLSIRGVVAQLEHIMGAR